MRLVHLSLAWVLGICVGSRYEIDTGILVALIAVVAPLVLLSHRRSLLFWGGISLLLLLGGLFHFQSVPESDSLAAYRGPMEVRGVVSADPDVRDNTTTLRLEVNEIKVEEQWQTVSGTAQISAPKFPDLGRPRDFPYYRYGDRLELTGVLQTPRRSGEFDFKEYLAQRGVYSVLTHPTDVTLLESGQKPRPMELIYRLRHSMSKSLDEALPDPESSLARALLLGERGSMSNEVKEDFSRTGTTHLLAISGVNVSIIAGIVMGAGLFLFGRRRPTSFWLALGAIWFYTILSGMYPSAVRAAIMGSLWLYANRIGRPSSALTSLVLAAAVMLALNPRLLNDIGFQLSFAAMAGLVFLTPRFHEWGRKSFSHDDGEVSPLAGFVIGSCAVTLGAVLATLPMIAYHFGLISLMGLPATFFTLPATTVIILTAGIVGLAGIFAPAVASVTAWVTWLFAAYVIRTVELFAAIPLASIDFRVNLAAMGAYYAVMGCALWVPRNRDWFTSRFKVAKQGLRKAPQLAQRVPLKWLAAPLAVAAVLVWVAAFTASDGRLYVYVLDVGQGDAILISKGHRQILVDGGPSAGKLASQLGDRMPFWDRTIELVVLTHPDDDHLVGLVEVLRRYHVEKVLVTDEAVDSDIYREWRKLIGQKEIEPSVAQAGQQVRMGKDVTLTVLNPSGSSSTVPATDGDRNDASIVLRLEYDRFTVLLTGDAGTAAEQLLLKENVRLRSTVLKVSHHGSRTASSAEFLSEVRPVFAAISVGADNRFGHPAPEVISRIEKIVGPDGVLLTSDGGAVEFITDGKKLWIDRDR